MSNRRKPVVIAASVLALGAGGAGIAVATGGNSEEPVTGPDAERAANAAVDAVGGGTVTEVEYQDADGAGLYEVEVARGNGTQVEVHLNGSFEPLGTAADDDTASESEGDEGAD